MTFTVHLLCGRKTSKVIIFLSESAAKLWDIIELYGKAQLTHTEPMGTPCYTHQCERGLRIKFNLLPFVAPLREICPLQLAENPPL